MRPYMSPYKGSRDINIYIPQNLYEHTHEKFSVIYHQTKYDWISQEICNWIRGLIRCPYRIRYLLRY